jgi:hypothetical protein
MSGDDELWAGGLAAGIKGSFAYESLFSIYQYNRPPDVISQYWGGKQSRTFYEW